MFDKWMLSNIKSVDKGFVSLTDFFEETAFLVSKKCQFSTKEVEKHLWCLGQINECNASNTRLEKKQVIYKIVSLNR